MRRWMRIGTDAFSVALTSNGFKNPDANDVDEDDNYENIAGNHQVEQQPGQDDYYGFSENDLRTPLNEQEDLSEWDGFDPNTFLSDNNNNLQLQDDGELMCGLQPAYERTAQHLLSDQDSIMQEEYNDYMMNLPSLERPRNLNSDGAPYHLNNRLNKER